EVRLLHVLAVVPLRAGEAEEPLLQDRIAAVPQREREAEPALAVGDPQEPVLAPPVGAAPRVVVREVVPAAAVGRVVLADGRPLPLRQVRSPALPVPLPAAVLPETPDLGLPMRFLIHRRILLQLETRSRA